MDAGPSHAVVASEVNRRVDGTIEWDARGAAGTLRQNAPCDDGAGTVATVTNTDVVDVVGTRSGVSDLLMVWGVNRADQRSTATSFAGTGIEFRIDYGATADEGDQLQIASGGDNDTITVGTGRVALDTVGTAVVLAGSGFPRLSHRGGFGNDRISAAGSPETGASPTAGVDLDAESGRDIVIGGAGDDTLRGGIGNDEVEGGPGPDSVYGDTNIDILRMHDGVADALIDGGAGADTAYYDAGLETPVNVETLVGSGDPPPPPPPPHLRRRPTASTTAASAASTPAAASAGRDSVRPGARAWGTDVGRTADPGRR